MGTGMKVATGICVSMIVLGLLTIVFVDSLTHTHIKYGGFFLPLGTFMGWILMLIKSRR